ncbi:MAG: hypothetical protein Q9195_005632 [Heterodermia aff. obscurata]
MRFPLVPYLFFLVASLQCLALTIPDTRFQITPHYWGPQLRSTGVLISALDAMANLALNNFSAGLPETIFDFEEQPGVAIAILPLDWQRGGEMQRRFAVWGLYLAVFDMMKRSRYTCNTYHLFWEGTEVGTLGFVRGVIRPGLLSLGNGSTVPVINATDLPVVADPVFALNVELKGKMMPINDVFIAVLGALSDLAACPDKNARVVSGYSYRQAPVMAYLSFGTFGYRPLDPPPFLTFTHVIEALAHLPLVMFERRVFSEADMMLKLDGKDVGRGLLRQLRPLGGGGEGVASS